MTCFNRKEKTITAISNLISKNPKVANLKSSTEPRQPLRVLRYRQGVALELLTRCKYFEVYRMLINTERRQKVHYRADEIAYDQCSDGL